MEFKRIALVKLNELINREGFLKISSVSDGAIRLTYVNRMCVLSLYGNVTWFK